MIAISPVVKAPVATGMQVVELEYWLKQKSELLFAML
jgi:hypothetical protein